MACYPFFLVSMWVQLSLQIGLTLAIIQIKQIGAISSQQPLAAHKNMIDASLDLTGIFIVFLTCINAVTVAAVLSTNFMNLGKIPHYVVEGRGNGPRNKCR